MKIFPDFQLFVGLSVHPSPAESNVADTLKPDWKYLFIQSTYDTSRFNILPALANKFQRNKSIVTILTYLNCHFSIPNQNKPMVFDFQNIAPLPISNVCNNMPNTIIDFYWKIREFNRIRFNTQCHLDKKRLNELCTFD